VLIQGTLISLETIPHHKLSGVWKRKLEGGLVSSVPPFHSTVVGIMCSSNGMNFRLTVRSMLPHWVMVPVLLMLTPLESSFLPNWLTSLGRLYKTTAAEQNHSDSPSLGCASRVQQSPCLPLLSSSAAKPDSDEWIAVIALNEWLPDHSSSMDMLCVSAVHACIYWVVVFRSHFLDYDHSPLDSNYLRPRTIFLFTLITQVSVG